jgi:hypothetical protein
MSHYGTTRVVAISAMAPPDRRPRRSRQRIHQRAEGILHGCGRPESEVCVRANGRPAARLVQFPATSPLPRQGLILISTELAIVVLR